MKKTNKIEKWKERGLYLYCRLWRKHKLKRISIRTRILRALWVHELVVNLIYRESIKEKIEGCLPVLPLMEKAKRQKVQANSQSIMIIRAKIQQNKVSFHLTGTATFLAVPRLDFKGRSLETETSSRWRELGNERLFLS